MFISDYLSKLWLYLDINVKTNVTVYNRLVNTCITFNIDWSNQKIKLCVEVSIHQLLHGLIPDFLLKHNVSISSIGERCNNMSGFKILVDVTEGQLTQILINRNV